MSRFGKLTWLWLTALVVGLDLWTKHLAVTLVGFRERIEVIPGYLDWTHVYNKGAAFSLFADQPGWQRWFFAVIAIGVSVALVVWLKRLKPNETWLAVALALVLGGALGNLHDRVLLGHVVDFILAHWQDRYYFPAFNLADTAITIGAIMLALDMFIGKKSGDSEK